MSKYIPEPSVSAIKKRRLYMESVGRIQFHNIALTEVKQRVGSNCTYLSHLRTKGTIWFLAHLLINGEKRIIRVNSGKTNPSDLVTENYKSLVTQLNDYVGGKKSI